jgi:Ser/Thr protein kinase RdoA (MazF antagonist)
VTDHPRLRRWLHDDPADPGRWPLDRSEVQRLIAGIAPGSRAADLGGVMSLNAHLESAGLVLRVHQPFVTRDRLRAQQELRRRLAGCGLRVPAPAAWRGATVFRCGGRWAELDEYVPNERLPHALDSYAWLFEAMGALAGALASLDVSLSRPLYATYAPPGKLRRWVPVAEAAMRDDPEATDLARLLADLTRQLRRRWVPADALPVQLVHGDVRLSNVRRAPEGGTLYLDFGFAAHRPRVHEVAYAVVFMLLALADEDPARFPWAELPRLLALYQAAAGWRLTPAERRALLPYAVAATLFAAALAGFTDDPAGLLRDQAGFLRLGAWLLAHPDALLA